MVARVPRLNRTAAGKRVRRCRPSEVARSSQRGAHPKEVSMRLVGSSIVLLVSLSACDRGDVPREEKTPVPAASQQAAPGVTQAPAAPLAEPEKKLVVAEAE